jgi:hypothetical protein
VVSIIEYIHSRGMSVMLKLHIECFDSVWRGRISFPSNEEQIQGVVTDYWGPWFRSLTACMRHYARICTGLGVKAMCIGCEMSGADQKKPDLWRASVAALRERYSGIVTYQANDAGTLPRRWGDVLDLVGMSYYVPAAQKPGASLDEMIAALRPSVATLSQASEEMGKPIFFGECGCRSLVGGAIAPWDYHPAGPCDGQEQSNYLEAVWTLFHKEPWWRGLFWWTWDEHQVRPQNCTRAGDAGFTIAGKPAEAVLKRLYNRISP